jgi:undecaprenyl-diphosphatase
LHYSEAAIIGPFQTFALLAGISRSGIAMVGGLARGLSHRDAARFSLLLVTPVILAAGVLKLPSLAGDHIHGQVLVGAVVAGLASYFSVKWLTRCFETRTLIPFAIYSLLAGTICIIRFGSVPHPQNRRAANDCGVYDAASPNPQTKTRC